MFTQHEMSERDVATLLEDKGIRTTIHRIKITQFVLASKHPSADEVWTWAQETLPKVSRATIYNTLNELAAAGVIQELRFPHTSRVIYDTNVEHHYHFLDEDSGELVDIDARQVQVTTELSKTFEIAGMNILFRGTRKSAKE